MANEKWGVTYTERQTIPGDERSRTNPGHGYPEHTVCFNVLKEFATKYDLSKWVEKEVESKSTRDYKCWMLTPITVTTRIVVDLE